MEGGKLRENKEKRNSEREKGMKKEKRREEKGRNMKKRE